MKLRKKIAAALALALVLQGAPGMAPKTPQIEITDIAPDEVGDVGGIQREIEMSQPGSDGIVKAYAAEGDTPSSTPTPTTSPTPTGTDGATTPTPPINVTDLNNLKFFFINGPDNYEQPDLIEMEKGTDKQNVYIGSSLGYITSDMKITKWETSEDQIISVKQAGDPGDPGNPEKPDAYNLALEVSAKRIGTASLRVEITVTVGEETRVY